MANKHGGTAKPVAVGEVNGFDVEVMGWGSWNNPKFYFVISKDGEITEKSATYFGTMEEALDAAIQVIIPDAQPVHATEPEQKDFEALSMLLYCGGLNQDLETLAEVITMHNDFDRALETLAKGRAKAKKDFEYAVRALKATHGPMHNGVIDLAALAEVFDAQCEVIKLITERNITTLQSFMQEFLK